ncbi:MAG: ribonuclease P protein component [Pseudomonadota bacterium]
MSFRLTREHRLLKAHDFSQVFEGAKIKVSSPQLLLLGVASDQQHARIGLVISKKNVGDAVERNRVKRLCREVFRHRSAQLPVLDIVVLARPGLNALSNEKIVGMLNRLLDGMSEQFQKRKASCAVAGTSHVENLPD